MNDADPTAAACLRHGTPHHLAGAAPLVLNDPRYAYLVLTGAVDVFATAADGRRCHLLSAEPGSLLFAMPDSGLLGVGGSGTAVVAVALPLLRELAAQPAHAATLAAGLEAWIIGLSRGLAAFATNRPMGEQVLAAGQRRAVKSGQRITAGRGVVWLRPEGGSRPLYCDIAEMPETASGVPLTPDVWCTALADVEIAAGDTAARLADGSAWQGLAAMNSLADEMLPLQLGLANADELNRLRNRSAGDEAIGQSVLRGLAGLLQRQPAPLAVESQEPLLRACAAIGAAQGFQVVAPLRRRQRDAADDLSVEAIAAASRLMTRMVALTEGWWRRDTGPLLAFTADGRRPLAILRDGRHAVVFDPVDDTLRPMTAEMARCLAPKGIMFYPALPDQPLGGGALARFMLRRSGPDLATLLAGGAGAAGLALAVPMGTSLVIDSVVPDGDLPQLVELGVVLSVVALVAFALQYIALLTAQRIDGRAGTALQAAVLNRLLRLDTSFFRRFSAGDLAMRTMAIYQMQKMVTGMAMGALLSGVFSLFSFVLMFVQDGALALAAVGLALLLGLATILLAAVRLRHERQVAIMTGRLQGLLLQLAAGIAKLRLAAAETRAFARFAVPFAQYQRHSFGARQATAVLESVNTVMLIAAPAAMFALAAGDSGPATGTFAAFLGALSFFLVSFTRMSQIGMELLAIRPLFDMAEPILKTAPEADIRKADPGSLTGAIDISHLTFRYRRDGAPVLDDISLTIRPGQLVALVGPSGCGKSTLLRHLLGFETPESGGIFLDGQDLRSLDIAAVRRQMGVVLQNGRLMPGSLFENIVGAAADCTLADAQRAIEMVGLADDIKRLPMGLHTVVTEAGGAFSGGQVQRLLLARAIVHRPRILLLDEATSALDNTTQAIVTSSLNELSSTRIVVAHRLSTVAAADHIHVLGGGRVVESGSYAALMATNGAFAELAERQLV